ncbi:hypothetical protein LOC73_10195 [Mycolicibacterium mageritense]|nr:hypothetical protein [Mycolicibacterium mageritense]
MMPIPHHPANCPGCLNAQPPAARSDGAWRIGERWSPFYLLPNDFRWWRRPMRSADIVEYQITDDQAAVLLTVVLDGITRVPIRADEVARARVITQDRVPTGLYADRMIATTHVVVDVLTNLPPARLLPWRPLTDPGDFDPPPDRRRRYDAGPPPHNVEERSTWLPPDSLALDRLRYGV